jgi:hypothetical protein
VSPHVAAMIKDLPPRIEYARAMPCRSIRPKNQDPASSRDDDLDLSRLECHNQASHQRFHDVTANTTPYPLFS